MATIDLKGRIALVTGASSGLGVAFAHHLAARGADLVITARRAENLEAVAKDLREKHGVKVTVAVLDLSAPGSVEKLWAATEEAGLAIEVLVNNAGGGIHQNFVDTPWDALARQVQLNVVSLTELTHRFARAMLARGRGYILNVASVGAYTPTPTLATYSAGKAFVRDMTEAIAYELRDSPVRVCCLCPGATITEFHKVAGNDPSFLVRPTFMTADRCAEIGLRSLFGGRRNVISGFVNKLSMFLLRFLPRRTMVWFTALTMGEPKPARALPP
jgi:short-subunit dehydrogenase